MAKFLLLSSGSRAAHERLTDEERAASMAYWAQLTQDLMDAGLFIAGGHADSAAVTTLHGVANELHVADESGVPQDEYVGGYFLLDAPDVETVIDHMNKVDYGSDRYNSICVHEIQILPVFDPPPTAILPASEERALIPA